MKKILFFLFSICMGVSACSSSKKLQPSMIIQGIHGQVTEASGNQMPMKGAPAANVKGILSTVCIYEPTQLRQVTQLGTSPIYTKISTKQVASIQTDADGRFSVDLSPGVYSVFVKLDGQYFANRFDADNNISLYKVEEGKMTEAKIVVNHKATY